MTFRTRPKLTTHRWEDGRQISPCFVYETPRFFYNHFSTRLTILSDCWDCHKLLTVSDEMESKCTFELEGRLDILLLAV